MPADHKGKITRRAAALGLLALPLAACVTGGSDITGSIAGSAQPRRKRASGPGTISFEPIIGPPSSVVSGLGRELAAAAVEKKVAVVPAGSGATYRIKGYMAAARSGGEIEFIYIWDIITPDNQRLQRITGTETAPAAGGDAWSQLDTERLNKIAVATIDGLIAATGGAG